MTLRKLTLVLATAALLSAQADVALQRAIRTETIEGDLKAAIAQYGKLAEGKDRAIAAQALIRMAGCYEKTGTTQAREIYERVVREYADQTESAAEAQARLAGMKWAPSGRTVRHLFGDLFISPRSAPSPDGRYIPFREGSSVDSYAVLDTLTGRMDKPIPSNASAPLLSPDGSRVIYSSEGQVHMVNRDGTNRRSISGGLKYNWGYVNSWCPVRDEISIVFQETQESSEVLATVQIGDGSVHRLFDGKVGRITWNFYTPDGRYIVFIHLPQKTGREGYISAVPSSGGEPIPIIERPAIHQLIGMTSDGRLLYTSDRMGTVDAYSILIRDGMPAGEPRLVERNVEKHLPLGLTRNGSYYYRISTDLYDIFTVELDPETSELIAGPTAVPTRFVGAAFTPDYSRDGESLVYLSGPEDSESRRIRIRTVSTGEERELPAPLPKIRTLRWYPDGRSLVVYGQNQRGTNGFYQLSLETGDLSTIYEFEGETGSPPRFTRNPSFSPDGKTMYFKRGLVTGNVTEIVAMNLATREIRTIVREETPNWIRPWALSRDGKMIAMGLRTPNGEAIQILPAEGGERREIFRYPKEEYQRGFDGIEWTADSKGVLCHRIRTVGGGDEIWRFPIDGSRPKKLFDTGIVHRIAVHPDGRHLTFKAHRWRNDVYVLENFVEVGSAE